MPQLQRQGFTPSNPFIQALNYVRERRVHSLIVTCRLHGIDPYTFLVDVLQRISEHPASRVAELTPRLWKQHFAANPLRSDLHDFPS